MNKVMIGIPTAEMARRADFYDYLNILVKPEGTIATSSHAQSPAKGRNLIIQQALDNECTHVFFIDDDVALPPNTLNKLLEWDKDMISGLYFMRNYPHYPIAFDVADEVGKCTHHFLQDEESGLLKVIATGLGCCLIKTEVFKAMEQQWIRLGQLESDQWCDDIDFFLRANKLGFELYCDLDMRIGHMASCTLWPQYQDGKWFTAYDTKGTDGVITPQMSTWKALTS
jgi:hypothetical protein